MEVRISEGVWAVTRPDGVLLGLLDGSVADGWRSSAALLAQTALPVVIRALNSSGLWTDGTIHLSVADGCARLALPQKVARVLDEEATARLQIVCALARAGIAGPGRDTPPREHVTTLRRSLLLHGRRRVAEPTGRIDLRATGSGRVTVAVPTARGPAKIELPALELLVASDEAAQDDADVEILLTDEVGVRITLRLSSADTRRAAVEAQWLLPGIAQEERD